jgi:hypothetical protein
MGRHEDIKELCMRILNYYYVDADTEFPIYENQRIDVVGYHKNKESPDVGIEVEITSHFQHDASKLANVSSFQLRFIVTENSDTLSMGPITKVNEKVIDIVQPPDMDMAFEQKVREFTNQNDKPWYNYKEPSVSSESDKDMLSDFIKDIQYQGLNVNAAKDILFRAALGGIHMGAYTQGRINTEYHGDSSTKEMLYLTAQGLILEDRPGRNYETGRQSVYYISNNGRTLAGKIIEEKVDQNIDGLYGVQEKYGLPVLLISLIGGGGRLLDWDEPSYSSVGDPYSYMSTSVNSIPRDLVEKFNIPSNLYSQMVLVAKSPLFMDTVREIYRDLIAEGLGNETVYVSSKGDTSKAYVVPLYILLQKLNVSEGLSHIGKLKSYAEWLILRGHNPVVPSTLYDAFKGIGSDVHNLENLVDKLASMGITSRLLKNGPNTMAIYDQKKFNDFCEKEMKTILKDILENDL